MKPTIGRIVEYVLKDKYGQLQVRPAIIVRVWNPDEDLVQLQVFTDGTNDGPEYSTGIYWATSVHRSENKEERTWDWMEYQKGQAAKTEELEKNLSEKTITVNVTVDGRNQPIDVIELVTDELRKRGIIE